jgi:hypothetical protein
MAIKTSDLKVGDVLHDIHRVKAGNTTMSVEGHWEVYVKAVADDGSWADLSWNGNRPRRVYGSTKYKRWPKEWYSPSISGGRQCAICFAGESDGHRDDCDHPRAAAARKRRSSGRPA